MGYRSLYLVVFAAWALAACAGNGASSETAADTGTQAAAAKPGEDALLALLPDRTSADCTGRLEFVTDRRVEGRSDCSGPFGGATDSSVTAGTLCVYSSAVESRSGTEVTAAGHFVCSDGNHGTVQFKEKSGVAVGIATITAADGRVVTLTYQ